jgi:DNA-binding NtrC family response regulator
MYRPGPSGEQKAVERQRIVEALRLCGGNQTRAARVLGMSRRTLVSRLAEYGIPRPQDGTDDRSSSAPPPDPSPEVE